MTIIGKRLKLFAILSLLATISSVPAAAQCSPIQRLFGGCPGTAPAVPGIPAGEQSLVPKFEKVVYRSALLGRDQPVNDTYYATQETADALAQRFGASRTVGVPDPVNPDGYFVGADGLPAFQRFLVIPAGAILKNSSGDAIGRVTREFQVNVGVLADYFRRNPEDRFPAYSYVYGYPPEVFKKLSLAEQYVWGILQNLALEAQNKQGVENSLQNYKEAL